MVSSPFLITNIYFEQFCTAKFKEWQKQWIKIALGHSDVIRAWTPDKWPFILQA